ncbi:hypothetical protein [Xanthomonas tesorieronis]|uniref:hypothetical protein n=1 Tax=Xanthomonas tesorieronis TaxID=3160839 RepID=UPI0035148544
MGKRQRRQQGSAPARGAGRRRLSGWLRWPVSLLVVALAAASALSQLYVLVKALLSGVYIGGPRFGSPHVYLLDVDPRRYWFWMAWDGVATLVLLLLTVAIAWVFLLPDKPK